MSAPAIPPESGTERRLAALIATAVILLLVGVRLAALAPDSAATLAPAAFVHEAKSCLRPALESPAPAPLLDPFALAHRWGAAAVAITGQWDARLLSLGALVLAAGGIATLLLTLRRLVSPRRLALLALAGLGLELLAGRDTGTGFHALAHAWFWLTLLQLGLTANDRSSALGATGWIAGAVNLAASSLGAASAIAVLARDLRAGAPRRRIAASAALAVLGAVTLFVRPSAPAGAADALGALGATFAFPFDSAFFAALVWAPAAVVLWRWGRAPEPATNFAAPLVLAFGGAALVLAFAGVEPARAGLLLGVLANAVALAALPWTTGAARTRNFCLVAAWLIAVAHALAQPLVLPTPGRYEPVAESADDRARPAAAALAARAEVSALLPPPLRPPLALRAEPGRGGGFGEATPPDLAHPDGLPFSSSWHATSGAAAQGEFRGALLTTRASILQVRVAGALRPPETELVLVTESGREIAPLETGFATGSRWKRVNFHAPGEAFRIVARDRSATQWVAFTAPLELSQVGIFAAKFARTSGLWVWAAALCALGAAAWFGRAHWRSTLTAGEWRAVPWLGLAAYAVFFLPHVDSTAGPNDSGGYLNFAKTVSHGAVVETVRTPGLPPPAANNPELYIPSTAKVAPDGKMAPEYPPGMGLMIGLVGRVLPLEQATIAVMWLHLLASVVVTWWAARRFGLSEAWAWLAAGILGLSSVFLFQTLQPQSDGPSVFWVTAAVAFAWSGRERAGYVWLAGAATGMAVLVRPANALCIVPVLACLRDRPIALRNLVLAGLPAALWLMWFNLRQYGHPLSTGYGDMSTAWAPSFIWPTLVSYAQWLPVMFTPVVVAAFAAPWLGDFAPRARAVLGLWAGAYFVFYAAYWCTYDNWYNMRFVLPALPAVLVLGLHVCRAALARTPWTFFPADPAHAPLWPSVALTALLLGITASDTARREVLFWAHAARAHRVAVDWLRERAPANAIVIARHASNAVWHYTDFQLLRPDNETTRSPHFLERLSRTGRPIYSINQHWERRNFEWGHGRGDGLPDLPGKWERLAVLWEGEYIVWRWHPPTANGAP